MKRTLLLIVMFLSVLPLAAGKPKKPIKVSCMGNSITYGLKLENREQEAYPVQLQRMLGKNYLVGNFGKPGATLLRRGHRPYMEQEEFRKAMEFAGDIVIIHLGINDTDPRDWPVCGEDFIQDYLALIDSLKSVNPYARILVARMTPIGHTHPRFLTGTKQYHGEIQRAIEQVAELSGVQLFDFYEPLYHYPWMLPDAVHPTAEGATFMAQAAYSAITGKFGGLQLPVWYSNNMVLPRDRTFPIRGLADTGETVRVTLAGAHYETVAGKDGRWEVKAGPFPAMQSTRLSISAGKKTLKFDNVALGDLWLASGQSNMEMELCQTASAGEAAADPNLRLLDMKALWRTNDVAWSPQAVDSVRHLQYFQPAGWTVATPESIGRFSAVGYHFGKVLRDSLLVPVGIVCNAVGGSTAESWVDRELLETQYPEILQDWLNNPLIMEWARERAAKNLSQGEGSRHPYEPCYLWEAGILPLKDLPVEGILWYQGESNADNIGSHEELFPLLVDSWRGVFGPVPFYYAQLSSMNRPSWPAFRASQARLVYCRENLGMVKTEDLGEWEEVHYKNKKPVGERFAALALQDHYGREIPYNQHFTDSTLRLDYVLCGDASHQAVYWRQSFKGGPWAGRRHSLGRPLLRGNGQIRVLDPESGLCLYANSFSTLFQEWTVTEEATQVQKAFESSFQVPFPKQPVDIEITLLNTHGQVSGYLRHRIDPADILIRPLESSRLETRTVFEGGPLPETVDIVIVSEGYDTTESAKFFLDAGRAADALFSHEPFASNKDRFSIRAVFAPSAQSGVSIPHKGLWRSTAVSSHFDTFYSNRYLTTSAIWRVWDLIGTVPFEHVIVLANTANYGGGGIYNSITIMNSDHPTFVPVLVHEFGHAFGGLGDEYYYDDQFETQYPADTEPWEPNLTTLKDFSRKWADLLDQGAGLYEGGGYQSKGVYRPAPDCRMKTNECGSFCPVCTRAIVRMIDFYTR